MRARLVCADASAMAIGRPHGRVALPPLGAAEGGLVAGHTAATVPHQESTLQKMAFSEAWDETESPRFQNEVTSIYES